MNLEEVFALIDRHNDFTYLQGNCPEELITQAEEKIGRVFPADYRMFVKRYGAGSIGDLEIYGIVPQNPDFPAVPNAVWLNLKRRERNGYDPECLVISQSADGCAYHISLSDNVARCPVYLSPPHDLSIKQMESQRFSDFLASLIQSAVSEDDGE